MTAGIRSGQENRIMEPAVRLLLGGDLSPQTRAVLIRRVKEGARRQSEPGSDSMATPRSTRIGQAMIAEDQKQARPEGLAAFQAILLVTNLEGVGCA